MCSKNTVRFFALKREINHTDASSSTWSSTVGHDSILDAQGSISEYLHHTMASWPNMKLTCGLCARSLTRTFKTTWFVGSYIYWNQRRQGLPRLQNMRTYLLEERAVLHFDRRARPLTINWRQKPTETTVTCVIVMIISRNAAYYFSGVIDICRSNTKSSYFKASKIFHGQKRTTTRVNVHPAANMAGLDTGNFHPREDRLIW